MILTQDFEYLILYIQVNIYSIIRTMVMSLKKSSSGFGSFVANVSSNVRMKSFTIVMSFSEGAVRDSPGELFATSKYSRKKQKKVNN